MLAKLMRCISSGAGDALCLPSQVAVPTVKCLCIAQFSLANNMMATKLFTKLSRHAVNAARAIVRKKRELEQELWSGHEGHEGRQGVG